MYTISSVPVLKKKIQVVKSRTSLVRQTPISIQWALDSTVQMLVLHLNEQTYLQIKNSKTECDQTYHQKHKK